jgi:uncharacterized protein (TIGR00251 family)
VDGSAIRLRLRVSAHASRPVVVGRHGDAWKVRVTAAPERGRANEAVIDLLAETLAVPRSSVGLVSGAGARDKVVEVRGIARERAEELLTAAAARQEVAA